jgi:hypothetical protein
VEKGARLRKREKKKMDLSQKKRRWMVVGAWIFGPTKL